MTDPVVAPQPKAKPLDLPGRTKFGSMKEYSDHLKEIMSKLHLDALDKAKAGRS